LRPIRITRCRMLARIVIIIIIIIIIIAIIVTSPLLAFSLSPSLPPPSLSLTHTHTFSLFLSSPFSHYFFYTLSVSLCSFPPASSWLAISLLEISCLPLVSFPDQIFPPSPSLSLSLRVLCINHTTLLLFLSRQLSFRMLFLTLSLLDLTESLQSFALSFALIHACTHPFVPYEKDCKPITHNSLLLFIIIISYS